MNERVLVVDDEAAICASLRFALEDRYQVEVFTDPPAALARAAVGGFDLCLLDLRIGTMDGLEILSALLAFPEPPAVVMMTAYGSIASSVEAMRRGAFGYLTKPLDMAGLSAVASQAIEYRNLHRRVDYLNRELERRWGYEGMVGRSPGMHTVFNLVERLKDVDTTVIIRGESGTGKELVAQALHRAGRRRNEPFVELNCAAIPEALLEGELFGYRRGAFTGAVESRTGKFVHAGGGTLFLDEIGDLPLTLQGKLLRTLQEREVTPLGTNETIRVHARVIAATNHDLAAEVEAGRFRKDLFYRLKVMEIYLPPLRERTGDLPLLVAHFLDRFNESFHKFVRGFTGEANRIILDWPYPGNVRELANIVERAVLLCDEEWAGPAELPEELLRSGQTGLEAVSGPQRAGNLPATELFAALAGRRLEDVERELIRATLARNGGRRKATAMELDISERGLRDKMVRYKLS